MTALILSALITMTMPTHNVDGTQIPSSEYLIATVWRVGGDVPIEVQLALPGESILVETLQPYGSWYASCLLYTSPSPRDRTRSRMPSSA